jgi:hypothetical protein
MNITRNPIPRNTEPQTDFWEIQAEIPFTEVLEMMNEPGASRYLCHAIMNIIVDAKSRYSIDVYDDYALAYYRESANNPDNTADLSKQVIQQFFDYMRGLQQIYDYSRLLYISDSGSVEISPRISRREWLEKIITADPNASFVLNFKMSNNFVN